MNPTEQAGFGVFLLLVIPTTGWPLLQLLLWDVADWLEEKYPTAVYTVEVEVT